RARYRAAHSGPGRKAHFVLRRRFSLCASRGQFAKNGLHERGVDGRRLEELARRGPAGGQGLAVSFAGKLADLFRWFPKSGGLIQKLKTNGKLAGAEGFEPSPSTLTVWCPTGWTTPQHIEN